MNLTGQRCGFFFARAEERDASNGQKIVRRTRVFVLPPHQGSRLGGMPNASPTDLPGVLIRQGCLRSSEEKALTRRELSEGPNRKSA